MQIRDQLHRTISLPQTPKRIVSLVPSQTELLVDFGLKDNLVGITKFCVHPKNLRKEIPIVGGTKKVKIEKIEAARPDIILCNKEENTREMVVELEKIAAVHVSDIYNIKDACEMIRQYGSLFLAEGKSMEIIGKIKEEQESFQNYIKEKPILKTAYFIWKNPWMIVGGNTFINEMLRLNRFENAYENQSRYPEIELSDLKPVDLVLLSSEPFPFSKKHLTDFENIVPREKIRFVDGEFFSWYGSRLTKAFEYFKKLRESLEKID
jgi:ABC-type Fe3+-hydroxamate transport system substrate-binding protein